MIKSLLFFLNEIIKENKKQFKIYLIIFILFTAAIILFCIFLSDTTIKKYGEINQDSKNDITNIKIPDFDPWVPGILSDNKYFSLKHGVLVESEKYVGSIAGKVSSTFPTVKDDVYGYIESGAQLIEENTPYFYLKVTGEDNLSQKIRLSKDEYNESLNGYWVLSSEPLDNIYTPVLIKGNITNIVIYPDLEDRSVSITLSKENSDKLISSLTRVPSESVNFGDNVYGALLIADGSGLMYAQNLIFDNNANVLYMQSVNYNDVLYKIDLNVFNDVISKDGDNNEKQH